MSFVLAVIFGMFGVLLVGTGAYGTYQYYRLSRVPLRTPRDVSEGETVAMEVDIAEGTPTVEAPFSREQSPLTYWEVERYDYDDTGSNWSTIDEGVVHADRIETVHGGYDVPVEMPGQLGPDDVPDAGLGNEFTSGGVEFVEKTDDPPPHVERFENQHVDTLLDVGTRRRYSEDRLNEGESVTVYGHVEPTSGDVVSASNVELTPDGSEFLITASERAEAIQKRKMGALVSFALGGICLGGVWLVL